MSSDNNADLLMWVERAITASYEVSDLLDELYTNPAVPKQRLIETYNKLHQMLHRALVVAGALRAEDPAKYSDLMARMMKSCVRAITTKVFLSSEQADKEILKRFIESAHRAEQEAEKYTKKEQQA